MRRNAWRDDPPFLTEKQRQCRKRRNACWLACFLKRKDSLPQGEMSGNKQHLRLKDGTLEVCDQDTFHQPSLLDEETVLSEETCLVSDSLKRIGKNPLCFPSAAAAAKSLQSCPTLCHPIDGCPSGSPIPGIPQARTLEWVAISFSNASK